MSSTTNINFGHAAVVVNQRWTDFKAICASKSMLMQHVDDGGGYYTVFAIDKNIAYTCNIWYTNAPDGSEYTQTQNDLDRTDFETNYQSTSNSAIEQRSTDGRAVIRNTYASVSKYYHIRAFSFNTASSGSLVNNDPNDVAYGDMSYTMYDVNGAVTSTNALAVKTVLDFEPHWNYEIIGGKIDIPSAVSGSVGNQWWLAVMAVPDLPTNYGGSVDFVSKLNMETVMGNRIEVDGRATTLLKYSATYHTNKIRFIFWHPLGGSQRFQIYIDLFK
jgi:hypothetical protein